MARRFSTCFDTYPTPDETVTTRWWHVHSVVKEALPNKSNNVKRRQPWHRGQAIYHETSGERWSWGLLLWCGVVVFDHCGETCLGCIWNSKFVVGSDFSSPSTATYVRLLFTKKGVFAQ